MKSTKENIDRYRVLYARLYFAVLLVMLVLVLVNIFSLKDQEMDYGLGSYERVDEQWVDAGGNPFVIARTDSYAEEDGSISIYYDIPRMDGDTSLVFRTKNVAVEVLLSGECLYETQQQEAPFYNHSAGTRWNVVTVSEDVTGERLQMKISRSYLDGRAKVDNLYWGDVGQILLHLIRQNILGLIVSLLLLVTGFVFLIAYLVASYRRKEKDRGLLYLGMVAILVAVWCVLETNLLQLFTRHVQLVQVVDNMMLVLGGAMLYLYQDQIYGIFQNGLMRLFCGLHLGYVFMATMSQIVGGPDFHQTLNGAVVNYGVICVTFVWCILREGKRDAQGRRYKKHGLDYRTKLVGVSFLGLGILGDLIRYLLVDVMDRAALIRLGFLAFILCFGAGNLIHLFELIKQGYEVEIVSRLAYTDGLTGVGNRTAYLERKDELVRQDYPWEKLGIVAFDVNRLKEVNDTLGHHAGDRLIQAAAQAIQDSFGALGRVYRIGGDEFIVLLTGEGLEAAYQRAREDFDECLKETNASGEYDFRISIAYEVAWCSQVTLEGIRTTEEQADRRMYEEKVLMKSQ